MEAPVKSWIYELVRNSSSTCGFSLLNRYYFSNYLVIIDEFYIIAT